MLLNKKQLGYEKGITRNYLTALLLQLLFI